MYRRFALFLHPLLVADIDSREKVQNIWLEIPRNKIRTEPVLAVLRPQSRVKWTKTDIYLKVSLTPFLLSVLSPNNKTQATLGRIYIIINRTLLALNLYVDFLAALFLVLSGRAGVVVSVLDFRSEGRWFEARSLESCCFLRQQTLLHIVFLHPGV